MTIETDIRKILERRQSIHPEWTDGIEECWKEEVRILSESIPDTVEFLQSTCNDEEFYMLSEVFEELILATKSLDILKTLYERAQTIQDPEKKESVLYDVRIAEGAFEAFFAEE